MNEERFKKTMEGIKQGAEILKGKRKPARTTERVVQLAVVEKTVHRDPETSYRPL